MRLAVIGHVEWADVLHVDALPTAGEWMESTSLRSEPAGAGVTAARQLARLGGETTFFTTLTDDPLSDRSRVWFDDQPVELRATVRRGLAQRRAIVVVDGRAERTIVVHGPKLCPRGEDDVSWTDLDDFDAACVVCGDVGAIRAARRARVAVATARWLPTLRAAGIELDALVASASDPDETYAPGDLEPEPRLVVTTSGSDGGRYTIRGEPERRFAAAATPGPPVDSYGAGDSFLAGLTFALARGDEPATAVSLAACCGAAVVSAPGLEGQLASPDLPR